MKEWLGKVVDKEDLERHDKWLCMMWPRLQLLKELLSPKGSIWITADDTEAHRLKILLDEIFGETSFVSNVIWMKTDSPSRNDKDRTFSNYHDHLLVYANDEDMVDLVQQFREDLADAYPLTLSDGRKARRRQLRKNGKAARREDRETMWYPLKAPDGTAVYPLAPEGWEGRWVLKKAEWERRVKEGLTEWIKRDYGWVPYTIEIVSDEPAAPWKTIWDDVDQNRQARAQLTEIMGPNVTFQTPKPSSLIERILEVTGKSDAVVLDSFAGSGTTGQAVLAKNKEEGSHRRFILVECEDYANNLTAERVRRVAKGVKSSKNEALKGGLGGAFAFCTLGDPIDLERFFNGKTAPEWEQVARYVAYTATGQTLAKAPKKPGKDWFVGEAGGYRIHLIYEPDVEFMRSNKAALDMGTAERISKCAEGRPVLVYAAAKFMGQRDLSSLGITFCQLPYAIHRILGDGPNEA